ncbi:uncharacterized protein KY384_004578 [Bacidia gigantensis]|uniref:uncharacterized protein n=1 Tax=Bacidia gigantensis TaxID=2732470 RepID=UPI001D059AD6|nr:uncharacterized protein KY384_004578 [Bacidia gigantensis]KAG8531220.1 hypothetical protein KY384_004578 [Bacidia gigantensis]
MNPGATGHRRPGAFSSRPGSSPSIDSDDSPSSPPSARPQSREQSSQRHPQHVRHVLPNSTAASSTTSFSNFSRPGFHRQESNEPPSRHSGGEVKGHKRQHSQGFFEPTLPSATPNLSDQGVMSNLTASQIAAQAAMQHQSHSRQRSITIPSPQSSPPIGSATGTITGKRKPPPIQTGHSGADRSNGPPTSGSRPYNGSVGSNSAAAATAANAAYPGRLSPGFMGYEPPIPEKEPKLKEQKSKMKLFSKPKDKSNRDANIDKPLPSPNKFPTVPSSGLSKLVNPSTTSLADSITSGASLYSLNTGNTSTSTLVPTDRQRGEEKEKHKHHFLSRQKNKLRDRIADDHTLLLSSASSNSQPLNPSAPNTLYSFAPAPASPATTSFTGLDLRHAGKAVRERKREEKSLPFAPKITDIDKIDFAINPGRSTPGPSLFGPSTSNTIELPSAGGVSSILSNLRQEDAWDFLKAKLLVIFEGEEVRIPIEDLNRLLTMHIQRRIRTNNPTGLIEDLRDFLSVGFNSVDHTLRPIAETRLVRALVDTWGLLFGRLLPFIQAVFLPLDLEFKGHGTFLSARESADFWGADPSSTSEAFGNAFDVRRIVLLAYRDTLILPRYDALKTTFSRLSLESINPAAQPSPMVDSFDTLTSSSTARPGTAGSAHAAPPLSESYNSQSSTLYDPSDSSRSRGNSNLSAPELPSFTTTAPHSTLPTSFQGKHANSNSSRPALPDSTHVTDTVARMLQCVSVLASTQSNDEAQRKMEDLARALKLNWLGRGRTGRNRRGIVGGKGVWLG